MLPRSATAKVTPIWRKEDRAAHIYRVAASIMCQRGYEATSMTEIADAVGLTKAGMYHYIEGKETLLFEIMSFAMDMVDQHVIAPSRQVGDAEARLRTMVTLHATRILEMGGDVTILLDEMWALKTVHRRVIQVRKRVYFDMVRETLQQLSSEGKLRSIDTTVATFTLFGMINWISRWYRPGARLGVNAIARDFTEMAMNSVLISETESPKRKRGTPTPRKVRVLASVSKT